MLSVLTRGELESLRMHSGSMAGKKSAPLPQIPLRPQEHPCWGGNRDNQRPGKELPVLGEGWESPPSFPASQNPS